MQIAPDFDDYCWELAVRRHLAQLCPGRFILPAEDETRWTRLREALRQDYELVPEVKSHAATMLLT
jgi:hypothetical protein